MDASTGHAWGCEHHSNLHGLPACLMNVQTQHRRGAPGAWALKQGGGLFGGGGEPALVLEAAAAVAAGQPVAMDFGPSKTGAP